MLAGLTAAAWSGLEARTPVVASATLIRVGTGLIDFVLVTVTAFGLIPMLGAYVHQQSGAAFGEYSADGAIALWLVPFVFIVVMLTVTEIAVMRWLWRAGSLRIRNLKCARFGGQNAAPAEAKPPAAAEPLRRRRAKNNRRRRAR
ncbi:hypothetical protein ACFOY4_01735 [Actinomadura syzygii]|uniref:Uncharacterized protein n=1 Tax=Actinomadura syzygii TaxID=1427538 RepID=A0A5D0TUL6_9ACTN|nr:hypothetical protein [Actinomadura syzygii]TYC08539.1 hypothetical protein FXF65_37210 [Actinomadura syzygii]